MPDDLQAQTLMSKVSQTLWIHAEQVSVWCSKASLSVLLDVSQSTTIAASSTQTCSALEVRIMNTTARCSEIKGGEVEGQMATHSYTFKIAPPALS